MWSTPAPALAFIFAVDLLAILAVATLWPADAVTTTRTWIQFVALITVAVGYAELSTRVETIRRYVSDNKVIAGMYTLWVVAAALVLPVALAMLVAVVLTAHTVARAGQRKVGRSYRLIFSGLSCAVAAGVSALLATLGGAQASIADGRWTTASAGALVLATVAYVVVDNGFVMCGVYLAQRPLRLRELSMSRDNLTLEAVTVVLGTFAAIVLAHALWLLPVICLVLSVVQRSVLVTQLQEAVKTDAKTGLLTAATWQARAEREMARAARSSAPAAVLVVDLDHFKLVNDERGHLAGDEVLKAAADGLRAELRAYDVAGRHGGEEFAILAPDTDAEQALVIANRIRERIAANTASTGGSAVTASIGIACFPDHGAEVRDLFATADAAMYAAKRGGRDLAVVASMPPAARLLSA